MTHMEPVIRSQQRSILTVVAVLLGPVFVVGPAAGGVWFFVATGPGFQSTFVLLVLVGYSGFAAYHMLQNFHWVEFDGIRIRGRRFWTRQLVEGAVEDVIEIRPLAAVVRNTATTLADKLLGPVRGYEIRFRNGQRVALLRHEMTNVHELVRAVQQVIEARGAPRPQGGASFQQPDGHRHNQQSL
jgi:hypothetical protein